MPFTIDQAELIGASIESVLYGIYLIILPASIYVLINRQRERMGMALTNKLLLVGAVVLFILVTADWVIDQSRLWAAFIEQQDTPQRALRFYALLRDKRNVLRIAAFIFEVATVDSLLLYRLFIVWNRDWRVIVLPMATFTGTIVMGVLDCIGFAHAPPEAVLWDLKVSKFIVAGFTCNLLTNVLAVVLISGRILVREHATRSTATYKSSLTWIILSLVESAGIYCVFNFMVMIAVALETPFAFTIFTAASPVTGISFCLITLRVGLSDWLNRLSIPSYAPSPARRRTSIPMLVNIRRDRNNSVAESSSGCIVKEPPLQDTLPVLSCV